FARVTALPDDGAGGGEAGVRVLRNDEGRHPAVSDPDGVAGCKGLVGGVREVEGSRGDGGADAVAHDLLRILLEGGILQGRAGLVDRLGLDRGLADLDGEVEGAELLHTLEVAVRELV